MSNPLDGLLSDELKLTSKQLNNLNAIQQFIRGTASGVNKCTACNLHKDRKPNANPVPGAGRGRIMIVGHRIGGAEEREGEPGVGLTSQRGFRMMVEELAPKAKFRTRNVREHVLDYVYMTNASRCGATKEAKPTKPNWRECGKLWLSQEIQHVDPIVLVFWQKGVAQTVISEGVPATNAVFEGHVYGKKRQCFVMDHPANIQHNPAFEAVIRASFRILGRWLQEQGYMEGVPLGKKETEHRLVTTHAQFEDMLEDLVDAPDVAIDTETSFFKGSQNFTAYERKNGALLWARDGFEAVCAQLAAVEVDEDGYPEVPVTYTVATGFRDPFTKARHQELTNEDLAEGLDWLFSEYPDPNNTDLRRRVHMFNASFDVPVLVRSGLDVAGFGAYDKYPIEIWDSQLIMARINEHLRQTGGLSLDRCSVLLIGEPKGAGFSDYFDDVLSFPYEDIRREDVQDYVLAYTGEDPRKTGLVAMHAFDRLKEHAREVGAVTSKKESSHPIMGDPIFPEINAFFSRSRMNDVAIPLDHQLIPIVAEMEMMGFKLDREGIEDIVPFVQRVDQTMTRLIDQSVSGFRSENSYDMRRFLHRLFAETADNVKAVYEAAAEHNESLAAHIAKAFQLKKLKFTEEYFVKTYEEGYDELNAQQDTIEDKIMTYFIEGQKGVRHVINDMAEPKLKQKLDTLMPVFDTEKHKLFLNRVFAHRQFKKKWSTYFGRFKEQADDDNIVRPSFNLVGTTSGRFAGDFMNIPRGGEEDEAFVMQLFKVMGHDIPDTDKARKAFLERYNKVDVRQYVSALQPEDINRTFKRMHLSTNGTPWQVNEDDEYVFVTADFAAQEDRMSYVLTGDDTKASLLANPDLDTHFYNAAYCFGPIEGFDTTNEEELAAAYEFFTKQQAIADTKELLENLHKVPDGVVKIDGEHITVEEAEPLLKDQLKALKKEKKENKTKYRTPMKTVHYASQYGAGEAKLHILLRPVFTNMGKTWTEQDTTDLKSRYDALYQKVVESRERIMHDLDENPFLEYPVYGTIRHAKNIDGEVFQTEYLSVANAINQGTSAYLTKTAMVRMRELIWTNAERWNLVQAGGDCYVGFALQVHDEIAVLAPKHLAVEVAEVLESAMKIIFGPPKNGNMKAHWDEEVQDFRGKSGWVYYPDESFKGEALFDADAEVKITLAKAKTLASGEPNIISFEELTEEFGEIEHEEPLVTGHISSGLKPF